VTETELRVLPVLFKYYDKNPISTLTIRNKTDQPVSNITVTFYTQEFMINPKPCAGPFHLAPGEEKQVKIFALFTDKILTVFEGTKVSSNITIDYLFKGKDRKEEMIETLDVASRNGIVEDRVLECIMIIWKQYQRV